MNFLLENLIEKKTEVLKNRKKGLLKKFRIKKKLLKFCKVIKIPNRNIEKLGKSKKLTLEEISTEN